MPDFEMPYFIDGGGNKGYFKDVAARDQIAALTNIVNYTVSDITELHQSMTINEFSLRVCGKIVTLGMNFSTSATIPVFTQLFKLPSGIKSFGRIDAVGAFTNKTLQAGLCVTSGGYVMANSSIDTGTYYMGQIVFIRN